MLESIQVFFFKATHQASNLKENPATSHRITLIYNDFYAGSREESDNGARDLKEGFKIVPYSYYKDKHAARVQATPSAIDDDRLETLLLRLQVMAKAYASRRQKKERDVKLQQFETAFPPVNARRVQPCPGQG